MSIFAPLPKKQYDIIYADPAWQYNGNGYYNKNKKSKNKVTSAETLHYDTLSIEKMKQLPVHSISNKDCLLFMWVTNPHLDVGIELGKYWGFDYKTVAFVWDKQRYNPGKYTMSQCEMCLVFKKGRIPTPRGVRNIKQFLSKKATRHSEKPLEIKKMITQMFPTQKKIELFARKHFL